MGNAYKKKKTTLFLVNKVRASGSVINDNSTSGWSNGNTYTCWVVVTEALFITWPVTETSNFSMSDDTLTLSCQLSHYPAHQHDQHQVEHRHGNSVPGWKYIKSWILLNIRNTYIDTHLTTYLIHLIYWFVFYRCLALLTGLTHSRL